MTPLDAFAFACLAFPLVAVVVATVAARLRDCVAFDAVRWPDMIYVDGATLTLNPLTRRYR